MDVLLLTGIPFTLLVSQFFTVKLLYYDGKNSSGGISVLFLLQQVAKT